MAPDLRTEPDERELRELLNDPLHRKLCREFHDGFRKRAPFKSLEEAQAFVAWRNRRAALWHWLDPL
jgi:hypothetical protein